MKYTEICSLGRKRNEQLSQSLLYKPKQWQCWDLLEIKAISFMKVSWYFWLLDRLQTKCNRKTAQSFSKPSSSPLCISSLCLLLLLTQNTSFLTLLISKHVKVFPCNKQFCDLNRVFENLTQFWHDWPGDSARFHTLRVQSHKRVHATAFAHTNPFQCQAKVQVTICISDQKAVDQHFQPSSNNPFFGFD